MLWRSDCTAAASIRPITPKSSLGCVPSRYRRLSLRRRSKRPQIRRGHLATLGATIRTDIEAVVAEFVALGVAEASRLEDLIADPRGSQASACHRCRASSGRLCTVERPGSDCFAATKSEFGNVSFLGREQSYSEFGSGHSSARSFDRPVNGSTGHRADARTGDNERRKLPGTSSPTSQRSSVSRSPERHRCSLRPPMPRINRLISPRVSH